MIALSSLVLLISVIAAESKTFRNRHGPPPIKVPIGRTSSPVWANITQRVDHFNPVDKRTWTMRYVYNGECFKSGGPIFLTLGGEWTISTVDLMAGTFYDIACENGGYMFNTEHRYYGESQPTRTCQPMNVTTPGRAFFFNTIADAFAGLVQYAVPGEIESVCFQIENATGSNVEKIAPYVRTQYVDSSCMVLYNDFIDQHSSPNITLDMNRQWYYQICTEFGWLQTSTSTNQPFGNTFPLELYYQLCKDLFGVEYDEEVLSVGVERTNAFNGADTPEISRLISVHGSVDPWHPVGLLKDLHSTALGFVVQGSSHCADLNSASDIDSEQIKQTKLTIRTTIAKWLDEIKDGTSSGTTLRISIVIILTTTLLHLMYNF
ncbi:putative serine protease K12H4.7 [Agrilus planipennis]|uniref:Serine protease K12H4.7 n=1 Tax=Agrilus planipennis TaxID=224129 RepID=A0A7F5QWX9_AGRPL|nr:putative serine protease K12H4.7 [Agrilus planipennis]